MVNISVSSLHVGAMGVNCWLLANEDTKEALVFDPGGDADRIRAYAEKNGWTIRAILLTHGHGDHMGGAGELKELCRAPVYALQEEREVLLDAAMNLSPSINGRSLSLEADEYVKGGQELVLAGITLKVLHTPGHTPGGCSYYCEEAGCVFSGDTLFQASVGRTDFPGGSMSQLVRSVKEELFALPDETRVCPGHMGDTTIGYEKKYNPFV